MPPPPRPTKAAQVADLVRGMVHDGRLAEGDPLPSTRALAAELGLARGTVTAAYEQLDGEGYVVLRHGAVPRVAATLGVLPTDTARSADAAPRPWPRPAAAPGPTTRPTAVVDLQPGVPAVSAVSARDWRAAWRHAAAQPLVAAYPDPAGEPALRAQVANQLALSRGFAPDAGRVVVTGGTAEAISLVVEAVARRSGPGPVPRVAVENPGYRAGRRAIASAGGVVVPVPVDDGGMDLDALRVAHARERLDAVLVTPSHQYPLGSAMPVAARHELLAWASAEGVLVVEDDYDSEFRHRGSPLPALAALDRTGVVVHVGSFSKVLDPRLRCGYLVLPAGSTVPDDGTPAGASILAARSGRGATVASVTQHALAHLMSTGALRRHVARCRRDYRTKRRMVAQAFEGVPGVRVRALDGGLHAVLELDRIPAADLVARLAGRGVLVADLQDYVVPGSGLELNGIVLGYAPPSATVLRGALRTIRAEAGSDRKP
ncbi:GntR family transcriptional regulator [Isoptericola sp. CG 20/1183]|uniref:GntR family transcriptional regulator n=1 Tax=Isoptericola halotolerans TaxID=300560 RepID=A0ABX5EHY7_9MICO|nr:MULTISPECIES: PLP-dependent aminotransferase family protein [Isoptericola]PRZ04088.1 GntR family transcriptional regulator [Isoptericola sp. CG 20/1183]PRZ10087.1 GntR family transcriptional regulator [Isoptericola halotolerans]